MIKVGLTGGIGSGKSVIARIFLSMKIPVYVSDYRAKLLMETDKEVVKKLKNYFGNKIYKNGKLNRKLLASMIFDDKVALDFVNSIVHPAVERDFRQWCQKQKSKYVVKESAILFEAGANKELNYVITVYAPVAVRVSRVTSRDKISEEQVRKRMENQWPDEKKVKLSDFVIVNDDKTFVLPQVLNLHNFFLKQQV